MDLSKDAIKMLRWMYRNNQWKYIEGMQAGYKNYDHATFAALIDAKYVDVTVFDIDYENPEYDQDGLEYFRESYRISDSGKAFLENRAVKHSPELRAWIALAISAIALIVSIIGLIN